MLVCDFNITYKRKKKQIKIYDWCKVHTQIIILEIATFEFLQLTFQILHLMYINKRLLIFRCNSIYIV